MHNHFYLPMSLPQNIILPRSKSIVIRCFIIHYLRTGELLPVFENDPNDIKIVYNALKKIIENANVTRNLLLVTNGNHSPFCKIDVQDCGAAYRFLMAILATTPGKWLLTGTRRLLERPILPLVEFLNKHGANIQKIDSGWHIEGKELQIAHCEIDISETSQFASAIMMVRGKRLEVRGKRYEVRGERLEVRGERLEVRGERLEVRGKRLEVRGERLEVRGGCFFQNPYIRMTDTILQSDNLNDSQFLTLSDWSAAVFWLANVILDKNAHYFLNDLHFDKLQGDAIITEWFEKWGLSFEEKERGIEVKHTNYIEIPAQNIDVAQTPDIALILATLSVCYPFELTLSGLKNINLKESNRLDIMINELSKFATIIKHSNDKITILKRNKKLPKKFEFNSFNDHRFVMAWALFKNYGNVKIKKSDCIKKSYPDFSKEVRGNPFSILL